MNDNPVPPANLRQLAETDKDDAALVLWLDTGAPQIVSLKLFNDHSYENRRRPHTVIITQADLELLAGEHLNKLTDNQFFELAMSLSITDQTD